MRRRSGSKLLVLPILLALAAIPGCKSGSLISESQEVDIGQQASRDIERQYPVSKDPRLNAMVNEIGQYIAARSNRPNLKYTFKVLDIKDVNAVSLPGGWVYVYKGLIDLLGGPANVNKDQLAGVIAHEVGHVAARHAAEQMSRSTLYGITIGVLTKGNTAQYANVFANLSLLRWSRKDEYEADKLGINYTYGSQYNPQGLVDFLKLLQAKSGSGSKSLAFLRTHPVTSERIDRAQTYLNQQKSGASP
ncbi:MAG: M48 family metallopeptidase [Armatimonadota bacterium]|nr:M48 family metallopeptidase [Armatimonadota bacterium]